MANFERKLDVKLPARYTVGDRGDVQVQQFGGDVVPASEAAVLKVVIDDIERHMTHRTKESDTDK